MYIVRYSVTHAFSHLCFFLHVPIQSKVKTSLCVPIIILEVLLAVDELPAAAHAVVEITPDIIIL